MFQDRDRMPTRRAALAACAAATLAPLAARATQFREITWTELVPAGWDPAKDLQGLSAGAGGLPDTDPRAKELMDKLREIWDNAPTVAAMNGIDAKLPGYLVPLEEGKQGIREFLLVPYFGACIHTPPPPANQIVHVRLDQPHKSLSTMDTVWISGRLQLARASTVHGVSGYALAGKRVERYAAPAR